MHFLQARNEKASLHPGAGRAHMGDILSRRLERSAMFHHDDHIRLTFGAPRRPGVAGSRARPRSSDVDVFLDKLGLSGRARRI